MTVLKVKWNKNNYDVDISSINHSIAFKEIILQLTGVPIDRQKLMCKGAWIGTLKDDVSFTNISFKEGQLCTLMGTAESIPVPVEKVVFIEDMTSEEKMLHSVVKTSAGLSNLGNTCYMNSTIQCLRHNTELIEALKDSPKQNSVVSSLYSTFDELNRSEESIMPGRFVLNVRRQFPQFAERSNHGHFLQQDAEEFFNSVTRLLRENFESNTEKYDSLLSVRLDDKLTCIEAESETPSHKYETVSKLVCNIQGSYNSITSVDHMQEGILLWLEGTVELYSEVLGRNALWQKSSRISRLPKFLCVQFMRFFWKPTPESADHQGVKCKILRSVSFPEKFDVFQFCSEELQAELRAVRVEQDKIFESSLKRAKTADDVDSVPSIPQLETVSNAVTTEAMDVVEGDDEEEAKALLEAINLSLNQPSSSASSISASHTESSSLLSHLPNGFAGLYELHSLVTHKGRSSDAGHYVGWCRKEEGSNEWWKYDDDKVSETTTEEVLKLRGGGDRDMAYLVFYRALGHKDQE